MGLKEAFERRNFAFLEFPDRHSAVSYLRDACAGKTVSFGGSVTVRDLGLYEALSDRSECFWHWKKCTFLTRLQTCESDFGSVQYNIIE